MSPSNLFAPYQNHNNRHLAQSREIAQSLLPQISENSKNLLMMMTHSASGTHPRRTLQVDVIEKSLRVSHELCHYHEQSTNRKAGRSWTVGELREYLDKRRHAGLPNEVNLKALDNLMIGTLEKWRDPTILLFDSLKIFATHATSDMLQSEDFGRWGGCGLLHEANQIICRFVNSAFDDSKDRALIIMDLETSEGVVYSESSRLDAPKNLSVFEEIKDKHLKQLSQSRYDTRAKAKYLELYPLEKEALDNESPPAIQKMRSRIDKPDFKETQVGEDPFQREIIVMAKMKAYYQYAAARYVEFVVMIAQKGLLNKLNDLDNHLKLKLHLEPRGSMF